jgi:hypothetical protein
MAVYSRSAPRFSRTCGAGLLPPIIGIIRILNPSDPTIAAEELGREIFERQYSDYRIDTQRSARVWPAESANR